MNVSREPNPLELVVRRRTMLTDDVLALDLGSPSGAALPAWTPGAHVDLELPNGLTRQYSLCGDPSDRSSWRVGVLRDPNSRGGSDYVHDKLHEGDLVAVGGPRNHFPLEPSPSYLFLAGGIGITPLIPMIAAAESTGATWELHYGGRTRAAMAFRTDLLELGTGRVVLHPQDEVGLMDLDSILGPIWPDTLVYCCGPEPLIARAEQCCSAWPAGSLHLERFAPKEVGAPVRTDAFEVELARTGTTVMVPAEKSILEAVEEVGVPVLSSCQEGTCGTCETAVLAGEVDHRDSLLTQEEQDAHNTMLICVSRAAGSKLVLDL